MTAAAGLGAAASMEYRRRMEDLSEMRRLFLLLSGEIKSSRTPVPEAFSHMASRMKEPYRSFLRELSERLSKMEGENFAVLWKNALEEKFGRGQSGLKRQDLELLNSFGDMFGYLDTEMQLNAIRFLQEQLLDRLGQLSGSCAAQMRMARLLGVSGGIFLVILLL